MMELERKTYDSLDDVVVQDHAWLVKYQRMLVRIDGHDIIVDRIFIHSYESMVSTCVYEAQASGRFGGCECKVLMHADEQHHRGDDDRRQELASLLSYGAESGTTFVRFHF